MSAMDLKFKGITWVGDIYQKFEAICNEVDNLVSQDPVKYVENQVQTGCVSVKKFCSGVMQELLPPSVDLVEHEAEAVPLKQNYENRTHIESIPEILLDIDAEEVPSDLDAIDSVENAWAEGLSFSGINLEDELMPELSVNSIEGEEFSLCFGENGDVPKYEHPDVGVEGVCKQEKPSSHQILGLQSLDKNDLCESPLSSGSGDGNLENTQVILSEVSPFCLVDDGGLNRHQELGSNCVDEKQSDFSFNDEGFQSSKLLGTTCGNSAETDCMYPLDSAGQVLSVEPCKNKVPTCSVHVEGSQSLQNSEMNCCNSDKTDYASGPSKLLLTAEKVLSVETGESKQTACAVNCEGHLSSQELETTCHYFENEIYSPYDSLHPLQSVEPNLSFETCENNATCHSVHNEGFQSPQELGSTYGKSADETAESTSDVLYPVLSFKQILSVETCEDETLACSVICEGTQSPQELGRISSESADETESATDPSHPHLFAGSVLSVENCENKASGCPVYNEGSQLPQELGTTCHKSSDHSASNPPHFILFAEQVLSAGTCQNKKLACSIQCEQFQFSEKFKHACVKSSDETDHASDPPIPLLSVEQLLSIETCENKITTCSIHDEGFQSPKNLKTICSDCEAQTDFISGHLISSEHSCESKVANMGLVCFSNSLATEAQHVVRLSSANTHLEGKICNPIGNALCALDVLSNLQSVNSIPLAPCLNGFSETGCSSACDVEPNGHSDDTGDDISSMDTIELSDKVGLEDGCLSMDDKELYAVSHRLQKLRSYRKKIQDAFTSKKRRAKEYEQLAIWYGDTDGESSQNTQILLPSSMIKQADAKKLPYDSCDSEWEFL